MLSPKEKQALRNTVEQFLLTNYSITPETVTSVTNVVLKNWFDDLENGSSHLTAEDIAANIADISHRYHYYKRP